MIGNIENAADAIDGVGFFDCGSARNAHLIDGIVYKVDTLIGSNRFEAATFERLSGISLPAHIAIPEYTVYDVDGTQVNAVEFIDGIKVYECQCFIMGRNSCDCDNPMDPDVVTDFGNLGIYDLVYGNVILRDGIYYLVDGDE